MSTHTLASYPWMCLPMRVGLQSEDPEALQGTVRYVFKPWRLQSQFSTQARQLTAATTISQTHLMSFNYKTMNTRIPSIRVIQGYLIKSFLMGQESTFVSCHFKTRPLPATCWSANCTVCPRGTVFVNRFTLQGRAVPSFDAYLNTGQTAEPADFVPS